MNKKKTTTISILLALLFSASSLYAQHKAKSFDVNLSTGLRTGGVTWDGANLNLNAGIEYFLAKNHSIQANVIYNNLDRTFQHSNAPAQLSDFGGALHYNYTFYTFNIFESHTWFYLYATLGGEYAQEKLTNTSDVPVYLIPSSTKQNLFGGDLGIGSELNFTRHFSLFGSIIPRWEFTYKEFVIQCNVGAKFYF